MAHDYEILERTVRYDGYFRIVEYCLHHELFNGGRSAPIRRECFERGHSVSVLPYDPELDAVALVEQFRVGALEAPRGPWLLEVIAGVIEPGEPPAAVARREALEEAGCRLDELIPISRYLVSPGGTSEQVVLFAARADLADVGGVHGLDEEDEDIRVHVVPMAEASEMLSNGTIQAAAPIIALQWLALNRERLRELWLDWGNTEEFL